MSEAGTSTRGTVAPRAPGLSASVTSAAALPMQRALTVVVGARRHDIVVDENLPLAELLSLVDPSLTGVLVTLRGAVLPPGQTVAEARLPTGALLLAADETTTTAGGEPTTRRRPPPGVAPGWVERGARSVPPPVPAAPTATLTPGGSSSRSELAAVAGSWTPPRSPLPLLPTPSGRSFAMDVGTGVSAVALAWLCTVALYAALGTAVGTDLTRDRWALATAGVLFAGGFVLAQVRHADRPARHLAPALGAVGGAAVAAALSGIGQLTIVGAAGGAAVVALAGRGDPGRSRHVPSVWALLSALVGAVGLWALAVGAPVSASAALVLALVSVLPRMLPAAAIDVDDNVLLDFGRLSVTSWSPRERRTRARGGWQIDVDQVDGLVGEAGTTLTSALVGVLALSIAASGAIALGGAGGHERAVAVVLAAAALAPALGARAFRRRSDRLLLRAAALPPALVLALPFVAGSAAVGPLLPVAVALVGVVLAGSAGTLASGSGSLMGSRLADALEGLSIVAVLPAALWSAGVVDWFHALFA